jgi:DnaK suppressor protein
MATSGSDIVAATRLRLRQRAGELREEIRNTLLRSDQESHARVAEQARDMGDDSFADLVVDLNFAEVSRDLGELREIDHAMQRLTDGTYGHCSDCGRAISSERLKVQPTAQRCIDCQEVFEKTHRAGTGASF